MGKKEDNYKEERIKDNRIGLIMGIVIVAVLVIFIALVIVNNVIDGGLASIFKSNNSIESSDQLSDDDNSGNIDNDNNDIENNSTTTDEERHGYPETENQLTSDYQLSAPASGEKIAVVTTSKGVMKFKFFPENAPKATENFIQKANSGHYNNSKFTAVYENQCVVSDGDDNTIYGDYFEDEYSINLHNFRGALGCAKTGGDDSNTNQFYIITSDSVKEEIIQAMSGEQAQSMGLGFSEEIISKYASFGGDPTLDGQFVVFGQLYEGWDVLAEIGKASAKDPDNGDNSLKEDISIISIEIKNN